MTAYGRFNAGQYIYLEGEWMRILYVRENGKIIVNKSMRESGIKDTIIVCMNRITVTCDGGTLTQLDISYRPKVR